MELDPSSPLARGAHLTDTERVTLDPMEPVKMEEGKETEIEGRLEDEEEEGEGLSGQLTSSRMGNVSATESSRMFLSLLAEGSSIRCDSSMQVCVIHFIQRTKSCFVLFLFHCMFNLLMYESCLVCLIKYL